MHGRQKGNGKEVSAKKKKWLALEIITGNGNPSAAQIDAPPGGVQAIF
jgi:hypothetical protein